MLEQRNILTNDLPEWFRFWVDGGGGVRITIHPAVVQEVQRRVVLHAAYITNEVKKNLKGLRAFVAPPADAWGFGAVLKQLQPKPNGWHSYRCAIPRVREGTGDREKYNYAEAFNVSLTLSILFDALEFLPEVPERGHTQLCTPRLMALGGLGGWPITANLSPRVAGWIKKQIPPVEGKEHFEQWLLLDVTDAMLATNRVLCGEDEDNSSTRGRFSVILQRPYAVHFSVPGDACGLDPSNQSFVFSDGWGYSLSPHNVDQPIQQLTLFAGLAALCEKVREDIKK